MEARVHDYWERASSSSKSKHPRGLSRKQNHRNQLKERIDELILQQTDDLKAYDDEKKKLISLQNRFRERIQENKKNREILQKAEMHWEKSKSKVSDATKAVLDLMQAPHYLAAEFGQKMIDLRANLDKVKLPESAAREFFQELADEEFCVCGRPIDSDSRQHILDNSQKYLGSEDIAVLNSIKDNIANFVGSDASSHERRLGSAIESLNKSVALSEELRTEYQDIKQNAVEEDPELKSIEDEIKDYEESVRAIEAKLSRYEENIRGASIKETTGIKLLEDELKKADAELAEITETVDLRDKTEKLINILARTKELAGKKLSEHICLEANQRIEKLMPSNDIRIDKIEKCLVLQGQGAGSVGETLTVSYAFLSTLFNRSDHNLPFVVDSPAGALDGDVRMEVASIVPLLTKQFIGFILNTERLSFLEPLERSAKNKNVQYSTLFRRGRQGFDKFEKDRANDPLIEMSDDGVLVREREFFIKFNPKTEEDNGV